MAVSLDDVRHIAALARLGLTDAHARALTAQMNGILGHMEVLSRVDTSSLPADETVPGMPLRADAGPPDGLARRPDGFAPATRDGFLLVPRLATHETGEES
ncbi:MAG: Asp-tRNA(Asn)/Glu-tRNA(Gln) amidotransferase subunit GatC [Gemmatimonadota bacterium]|nr:Asp-tRNA(Asn)/Glu-tRNA(Gln) amidotransferase subunit GatC [Gemmatimonadota bacterium]MDE3126499.1 Asp-tRNA(Asn)/Glu-tRNA(Gln) amidotransferase subunit GatC [Gemmatimonadota bacterium]MDE3171743.1 Asp-tRNA(Asn)/Glu-tRNA(Gln) amidotransferase subunit GatC [Gemmatimonadota bacterium]MDE3216176.1 Asp-tRNA(Asn)/Glu-tRNA(Gln) amidotransferase subunit GatC [Gemmatimonadota bacterium]